MFVTLVGIHPRTEELVRASREFERGRLSREAYENEVRKCISSVIEEQRRLGFSQVIDGMVKWEDIFRPFSRVLEGVEAGPLTRFFDNNTFFRRPVIRGKIEYRGGFPNYLSEGVEKAIVPGPYTFTDLSQNESYSSKLELMWDYADALKVIVKELKQKEITFIQLNEPSLVYRYKRREASDDELEVIATCFREISNVMKASVHLYFGECSEAAKKLAERGVEPIGVDMIETEHENLLDVPAKLILGVVDARNTYMEEVDRIAELVSEIGNAVGISPNCDLEFLPYEQARRKMQILKRVLEVVLCS